MNHKSHSIFFHDPEKLQEMLRLRKEGWSLPKLAARYNCDHQTILYHCRKKKIKLSVRVKLPPLPKCIICGKECGTYHNRYCSRECMGKGSQKKTISKVETIIEGERINQGKLYKEYVEEEKKKKNLLGLPPFKKLP